MKNVAFEFFEVENKLMYIEAFQVKVIKFHRSSKFSISVFLTACCHHDWIFERECCEAGMTNSFSPYPTDLLLYSMHLRLII